MYKFYSEKISFFDDVSIYNKYYELLSDDRKEKVDAYRFDGDKKRAVLVDYLLRKALMEKKLIDDNYKISYYTNEYGKPYLIDFKGVFFNFSHSGDYAICVISDNEIGCDIEIIKDIDFAVAKRFFTKNEYETIEKIVDLKERNELFFRYWTIKESYIKAIGLGLSKKLNDFEVIIDKNNNIIVEDKNIENRYSIEEIKHINGYKVSVCEKIIGNFCE